MMKLCVSIPLLFAATVCMGQSPATQPVPSEPAAVADHATIERLVANLGSKSRLVRESAEKRLVEIGLPAMRPLRAAAESGNEEVRSRATAVLLAIAQAREVCVKELGKVPQPFKDTRLFVSPDGEHVAYVLRPGGKEILVCDGNQSPAWDSIQQVGPFSRDGKSLPYRVTKDGNSFTVFAGQEDKPVPTTGTGRAIHSADQGRIAQALKAYKAVGPVVFSPDGKRFTFTARREGQEMIVCDGKEGPSHEDLWIPGGFANRAERLRYVVRDGDRVRLMETAWPEPMTWRDAVEKQ